MSPDAEVVILVVLGCALIVVRVLDIILTDLDALDRSDAENKGERRQ